MNASLCIKEEWVRNLKLLALFLCKLLLDTKGIEFLEFLNLPLFFLLHQLQAQHYREIVSAMQIYPLLGDKTNHETPLIVRSPAEKPPFVHCSLQKLP